MKKLILVFLFIFVTSTCLAGFGGARSGGSFSGGGRSFSGSSFGGSRSSFSGSSFGGSRASGGSVTRSFSAPAAPAVRSSTFGGNRASTTGPATITRPAPVAPQTTVIQSGGWHQPVVRETVIHHDSGPGFWSGLFMGSALNHHPAPVIVTGGGGGVVQGGSIMEPTVVVQQGHSFFFYLFWSALLVGCLFLVWKMWKESES